MSDKMDRRIAEIRARHKETQTRLARATRSYMPVSEYEGLGWQLQRDRATLLAEVARQRAEIERLRAQLNAAVTLLAAWSHAVDDGGASWDCWDTHYKEARWGKGLLRSLIDEEIAKIAKLDGKP